MTVLHSDRCRLAPLQEQDRASYLELVTDPEVRHHLGGPLTTATAEEKFAAMLLVSSGSGSSSGSEGRDGWHLSVRLQATEAFLGLISLTPHCDQKDWELSYQFLAKHWGQGYAEEALKALLANVRKLYGISRLLAETQATNYRSISLLARLGLHPIAHLERFGAPQVLYAWGAGGS